MNVHSECPQMVYADRFRVDDGDVSIQTTCQPSEAVLREIHEVAAPGTEGPSTPGVASDSPPNSVYCPQLFCGLTLSLFHRGRGNVSTPIGGAGRWEPLASVLPAHTVPRADRGPLIAAVRVFVAGVPALLASAEDHREVVVRQGLRPQREIGDGERWVLRRCHGIKRECRVSFSAVLSEGGSRARAQAQTNQSHSSSERQISESQKLQPHRFPQQSPSDMQMSPASLHPPKTDCKASRSRAVGRGGRSGRASMATRGTDGEARHWRTHRCGVASRFVSAVEVRLHASQIAAAFAVVHASSFIPASAKHIAERVVGQPGRAGRKVVNGEHRIVRHGGKGGVGGEGDAEGGCRVGHAGVKC